jgi:hypothetical protein
VIKVVESKRKFATDVDVRPALVVANTVQKTRIEKVVDLMEAARRALTTVRNDYREAFVLAYDTKSMRAALKEAEAADDIQRMSAMIAIESLTVLGASLQVSFPGKTCHEVRMATHLEQRTTNSKKALTMIKNALRLSDYTLSQVRRIMELMINHDEMPTVSGVLDALKSSYGRDKARKAASKSASIDEAIAKDTRKVSAALDTAHSKEDIGDAIQQGQRIAEDEYKEEIKRDDNVRLANTRAMVALRKEKHALWYALLRNEQSFLAKYEVYKTLRKSRYPKKRSEVAGIRRGV